MRLEWSTFSFYMFTITPSLQRHTITASYPMHTLCLNHTQNLQPTSLFIVSHRHLTLTLTIGIISSMTNLEHYIHSHRQLNILKITQYQKHLTMLCIAYMVPPYLPSLGTPTPSPHTYTVKPLKTATLWGMQKWPSYRGGRLMETHDDRVKKCFELKNMYMYLSLLCKNTNMGKNVYFVLFF